MMNAPTAGNLTDRYCQALFSIGWDLETGSVAVNYTFVEEPPVNDQPA
ncbi:hypothetical protein RFX04_07410 [Acinetobacter baumannii]|nr:hypothetical protein [Acinetobacter baumannii]